MGEWRGKKKVGGSGGTSWGRGTGVHAIANFKGREGQVLLAGNQYPRIPRGSRALVKYNQAILFLHCTELRLKRTLGFGSEVQSGPKVMRNSKF